MNHYAVTWTPPTQKHSRLKVLLTAQWGVWDETRVCVCHTNCCRKGQFGRLSSPPPSSSPSLTLLSLTIKLNLLLSTLESTLTVLSPHLSPCAPYTAPIHFTCPLEYKSLTSVTYTCLYQWAQRTTYWAIHTMCAHAIEERQGLVYSGIPRELYCTYPSAK